MMTKKGYHNIRQTVTFDCPPSRPPPIKNIAYPLLFPALAKAAALICVAIVAIV